MFYNKKYRESLRRLFPYIEIEDASILVTGATGLIGSCLIDLLALSNREKAKNLQIYALGRNRERLERRFYAYRDCDWFHFLEQDVRVPFDDNNHFDFIIHGASNADPVAYAKFPVETMTINLLGGHNVLEYGRKHTDCRIVMLSTFEVYGKLDNDIYVESDTGIIDFNSLRACYPESKRSMEIMSRCYVDEYNVNVSVARLCSIYGPTMTSGDSKAHAQFIRNAIEGKSIIMKSDGKQLRSYCYVLDAVSGVLTVLLKGKAGESYNISNDKSIVSIADVAHTLAELAGTQVVFDLPSEFEKKGFSNPQNCVLNNNRIKALGWIPLYDLKAGMEQTIAILKG